MGLRDIFRIGEFKQQIQDLTNQLAEQKAHFDEIGFTEYEQIQEALKQANEEVLSCNTTLQLSHRRPAGYAPCLPRLSPAVLMSLS